MTDQNKGSTSDQRTQAEVLATKSPAVEAGKQPQVGGQKPQEPANASALPTGALPLTQGVAGDKLATKPNDLDDVAPGASQAFRDKYQEVMKDFHAGTLRNASNAIVKSRDEAKTLAAEQAKRIEASPAGK